MLLCSLRRSLISFNNLSSELISSSSSTSTSDFFLNNRRKKKKIDRAIIKKSSTDCKKIPYRNSAEPTKNTKCSILTPFNKIPIKGTIISSTNELTICPKAPPIITATAKSIKFPSIANSLKSFHIILHLLLFNYNFIYLQFYIVSEL